MRGRTLLTYLVLAVAAIWMAASLFMVLDTLKDEHDERRSEFRDSITWFATQFEREARAFLGAVTRYHYGDADVSHEAVVEDFDVLWSRVDSAREGAVGRVYRGLDQAEPVISAAEASLERLDPVVLALKPGDTQGYGQVRDAVLPLLDEFHHLAMAAMQYQQATEEMRRLRFSERYWSAFSLLAGAVLAGAVLVVLILSKQRTLSGLHLTLEKRIAERTSALEASNRDLERAVAVREQARRALQRAQGELARRVEERTRELSAEVADRQQIERALRESEQRVRDIAESASDWFWEMDADLCFTYISDRFFQTLGTSPENHLGRTRPACAGVRGDETEAWREHMKALAQRLPFQGFEYALRDARGRERFLRIGGRPLFDSNGQFRGYRGAGSDVTERKVAQRELQAAHDELERRVAERTRELQDKVSELSDARRALQEQYNLLQALIEAIPAPIFYKDRDGRYLGCNEHFAGFIGLPRDRVVGHTVHDVAAPDLARRYAAADARLLEEGGTQLYETIVEHADGRKLDVMFHKAVFQGADGGAGGLVGAMLDITERKKTEDKLRKLSQAVEQSPASVLIVDTGGRIEYANRRHLQQNGYALEEVLGTAPTVLNPRAGDPDRCRRIWETIHEGREWRSELEQRSRHGHTFWVDISISAIRSTTGEITHFLVVEEDISLRKEQEERLVWQANFDQVTGLPNRMLVFDRLSQALVRSRRSGQMAGLLFIDLDHFKRVNDSMGHQAGDQLLKLASERFRDCVREGDTVARLGGDEFTVVLPDIRAGIDAEIVAEKILSAFSAPFVLEGREVFATASVGISLYPGDGDNPQTLMQNADAAMYQAKETGRNTARFFTQEMNEHVLERVRMETQLYHALQRGELSLVFQPFVNVRSGHMVGAEALLRWKNDDLGHVPPDRFVPLAEECGLIVPIGEWVIREACRVAANWQPLAEVPLSVSVNVSSRQFRDEGLVGTVLSALEDSGLPAGCLVLEITESLMVAAGSDAESMLRDLHALGVRISLDDFGTGYCSLSYAKRLPVSGLKIDRSFVRDAGTDPDDAALVRAILAIAHSLDLEVTGEGVETEEQRTFLRDEGCELAQGYLFSRPVDAGELLTRLSAGDENPARQA